MGVAKGHLDHGQCISFSYFAANHFANFAKRSYCGWVNMVTSSSKREQSVWLLMCHFDSNSVWLLLVKKSGNPEVDEHFLSFHC